MSDHLPAIVDDVRASLPAPIMAFSDRARDYASHAKAENTNRAYRTDWADFSAWCAGKGASALPAASATVLAYLIDRADTVKVSTLQRRLSAIREFHRYAGHQLDTGHVGFRDTWRGICRTKGLPPAKKAPVMTTDLRKVVAALPADTLAGIRDRALLLVGFAAALRRSELVSLLVSPVEGRSHVEETADGLLVHLVRSKTDQGGEGSTIGVPYGSNPATCPVRALKRWLEVSGIREGAAFRSISQHGRIGAGAITDKSVALIVKRAIVATSLADGATLEEANARAARFAGHSLRSGLATSAAANDAPGHAIQKQLRHKKFDTTSGYIQAGQIFKQNAAGMAGL
ncbi:tyrosine-type recombinase/integrase [Alsobacter sp. SYSU BS001988]